MLGEPQLERRNQQVDAEVGADEGEGDEEGVGGKGGHAVSTPVHDEAPPSGRDDLQASSRGTGRGTILNIFHSLCLPNML
jgi:hypothetical protein